MKVGDLVQKTHLGGGDPLPYKGIILSIQQGEPIYYKIKWFCSDIISDRWTELEFRLYKVYEKTLNKTKT